MAQGILLCYLWAKLNGFGNSIYFNVFIPFQMALHKADPIIVLASLQIVQADIAEKHPLPIKERGNILILLEEERFYPDCISRPGMLTVKLKHYTLNRFSMLLIKGVTSVVPLK